MNLTAGTRVLCYGQLTPGVVEGPHPNFKNCYRVKLNSGDFAAVAEENLIALPDYSKKQGRNESFP